MTKPVGLKLTAMVSIAMAVIVGLPSCGGGGANDDNFQDTATYTGLSDTLSALIGQLEGQKILREMQQYAILDDPTYSIDDFNDGLATIFDYRHPLAYTSGVAMGIKINQDIDPLEDAGIGINRKELVDKIAMSIDPTRIITPEAAQALGERYVELATRALNGGSSHVVDSLQSVYAEWIAAQLSGDIGNFNRNENRNYNLPQFIKGIRKMTENKGTDAFYGGAYQATILAQHIAVIEKKGVNIRPGTVLDEMQSVLKEGKPDSLQTENLALRVEEILSRIDRDYYEAEDLRMASTDRAIQNIKTGEALVARMKASNPDAQTTASGLTYIIKSRKNGTPIAESDTVVASYKGSHLDGKVFETYEKAVLVPSETVEGLREGLLMLGEGDKATFYIPGNIGYRGHGLPYSGVGPMETIIYDIEILSVQK